MNNLDPDVAERPDDLVVYGGQGKAARNWAAFDAIVRSLTILEHDETLLVQSGKPVGVFQTHPGAPRVLIANGLLVPAWATWENFRDLEHRGLTMFGQMTAGSWIYIGSQGIVQGTYETLAEVGRRHFGGSLAGRLVVTAGLGGMGGAQPLAATMNGATALVVEVDPQRIARRLATKYLDETTDSLDTALSRVDTWRRERVARSIGLCGNAADVVPALVARGVTPDVLTDQTSAHDSLNGYVPNGMSLDEAVRLRATNPAAYVERSTEAMAQHVRAMLALQSRGAITFDYGNNIRAQAQKAGVTNAFDISDRCFAKARGRSGGRRCREIPTISERPTRRRSRCSATTRPSSAGFGWPANAWPSRDCPRGSCGWGSARGPGSASASTNWCAKAGSRRRS